MASKPTLKPYWLNLCETTLYVSLLTQGDGSCMTFRSRPRDNACSATDLTQVFHGCIAQHGDALWELNCRGADIFVDVNAGHGVRHPEAWENRLDGITPVRRARNLVGLRALM